jgi:predicted RNA-binding Zn-ribbon protein involved in translation (DUF1610 family)
MHAPPRERLFILFAAAAMVGGFLLASDDERWMTWSLCALLSATLASLLAHAVDDHRLEELAALAWLVAIVTSARWITVPVVAVAVALTTVVGLPIVLRNEWRRRRSIVREAYARCVVCDYDLRASKRYCPECGTPRDGEVERLRRVRAAIRAERGGVNDGSGVYRSPGLMPPAAGSRGSPAAAGANGGRR